MTRIDTLLLRDGVAMPETAALGTKYGAARTGGVSVVSVIGATRQADKNDWKFFFSDTYLSLRGAMEEAVDDPETKAVVFLIDSPGGVANGLVECCESIRRMAARKPVHAVTDGQACSAAYALGAACTTFSAAPSAELGSCGIVSAVRKYDEGKAGVLTRVFRSKSAPRKWGDPFTEEGAKLLQERVDEIEDDYFGFIAKARGIDVEKCRETFGQGAVMSAREALGRGMIDRLEGYDELMSRLQEGLDEEDDMDVSKINVTEMSAQERSAFFAALVKESPELLAPARDEAVKAERERVGSLMALATGGKTREVVEKAMADGRGKAEVMEDIVKALRDENAELAAKAGAEKAGRMAGIVAAAEAQTDIKVPHKEPGEPGEAGMVDAMKAQVDAAVAAVLATFNQGKED